MTQTQSNPPRPSVDIPGHVQESIQSVAELRANMDREVATHQLGIEWFTKRLARPSVVYSSLVFVAVWITVNGTMQLTGARPIDPFPFFALQGLVTLAAFTMTILILTTQTRLGEVADRRARLALQVEILTEQKVAKLIEMIDLQRTDNPQLKNRPDPVAEAMSTPVDPATITKAVDETHKSIVGE